MFLLGFFISPEHKVLGVIYRDWSLFLDLLYVCLSMHKSIYQQLL